MTENEKKEIVDIDAIKDPVERHSALMKKFRFFFLGVIIFIEFGRYFCQELPSALQKKLQKTYGVDEAMYGVFQALYNMPNLVVPLITGYVLDRFGRPFGLLLCMLLLLLGQSLLSLSAHTAIATFSLACVARFVVGLGGKNVSVARTTYSSDWFKEKELSFALAISIGVSRLGVITAFALGPNLERIGKSLAFAFWFGAVFVLLSFICGLVTILID